MVIGFLRDAGAVPAVLAALFTSRVVCEQTVIPWARGAARDGFSPSNSCVDMAGIVFLLLAVAWSLALLIRRTLHRTRISAWDRALMALTAVCCVLWLVPAEQWMLFTARMHGVERAPNSWVVSAAANGQRRLLQYLFEHGADINARAQYGESPLAAAAASGCIETAAMLLARGAFLENRTAITRETPLTEAARMNHLAMVELLLTRGADVNARDAMNRRAVDWARDNGNEPMIQLLQAQRRTRRL